MLPKQMYKIIIEISKICSTVMPNSPRCNKKGIVKVVFHNLTNLVDNLLDGECRVKLLFYWRYHETPRLFCPVRREQLEKYSCIFEHSSTESYNRVIYSYQKLFDLKRTVMPNFNYSIVIYLRDYTYNIYHFAYNEY